VEVTLLDYYGRELNLWAAEGNTARLNEARSKLRETWDAVRPEVAAKGGATEAAQFDALVAKLARATLPKDFTAAAGPILDSVDALENVFTRAQSSPSTGALVDRGRYLATIGGCGDCHTPKTASMEPDASRLLSGAPADAPAPSAPNKPGEVVSSSGSTAFHGPWGISYAANLTPDPETGIAKDYTEQSFIQALRTGKSPDGGSILPPMPWQNYSTMTDDDLKALWAYLQSLKPVKNQVKPPVHAAGVKGAA